MNKYIKIISLLLCIAIAFSMVGCKKKQQENVSSNQSDLTESEANGDTTEEDIEDEDTAFDDWESIYPDDDFDEEDTFDQTDDEDYEDEEYDDDFGFGIYNSAEITLKNASAPIQKDFLGFNAIYHAYTFRDDSYNRVHTERSALAELEAVQKSGISVARTYYDYTLAWDGPNKSWNFESADMQALYRWCLELKARNIDVHLSYWSAFKELFDKYLTSDNKNKKDAYVYAAGSKVKAFYVEGNVEKTLENFATFINATLENLYAKGCTNVKYLSLSTEPGFGYLGDGKATPEQAAELYAKDFLSYSNAVHRKLKASGLRSKVKIIGPNEGARTTPYGYMSKAVCNLDTEGAIDYYSSHSYSTADNLIGDSYAFWDEDIKLKLSGLKCGKDNYIFDEYGVFHSGYSQGANWRREQGQYGTQIALQQIATLNNGIRGSYMWTLVDQQWPDNITTNITDYFDDGVHQWGLLPNFQINNVPYPGFYAFQLMANYLGVSGAEVYDVDYSLADSTGVYSAMVKLPDGNESVAVINMNYTAAAVKVNFEKSIGKTLYRHEFNPDEIIPTADATIIPPSAKITNCKKSFVDVLPALGLTVYTTKK
jgi:hypothetical protein